MIKIYTSTDIKKDIEIINNKEPLKEKIIKNKIGYILCLILSFILAVFRNKGLEIIEKTLICFIGSLITFTFSEIRDNKRKSQAKLKKVIDDISNKIDIEMKNFKNAVIKSETEKETYYLYDGEGTKVKRKKVVSYIGLNKKDKLIIFKQITEHFKYYNKNMKDIDKLDLYLLENEDLKNEKIINYDSSINEQHPLIKSLFKKQKVQ